MDTISSASDLLKSINILETIYFIKNARDRVTPNTIRNCFTKAGFRKSEAIEDVVQEEYDVEDDMLLTSLVEFWKNVKDIETLIQGNDFIRLDETLSTEELQLNYDKEKNDVKVSEKILVLGDSDNEEKEEDDSGTSSEMIGNYTEAIQVVESLKKFSKEDFIAFEYLNAL
ncbi:uncharacterized protein [Euwallacea similis]|uniref:uncharacterized protein n=1 Tax=Euwallacea similis TaxID=1736056 RepID=UPI003450B4FC